jgi:hypothetical protein
MKQSKQLKELKQPTDTEQFYIDHKTSKNLKTVKQIKCPMANKNCKQWEIEKQKCMRGWCGIA